MVYLCGEPKLNSLSTAGQGYRAVCRGFHSGEWPPDPHLQAEAASGEGQVYGDIQRALCHSTQLGPWPYKLSLYCIIYAVTLDLLFIMHMYCTKFGCN